MAVDGPAGATGRGRPRDAAADARILRTTFRHLMTEGYAGLSIEGVAADARVAKTTIYRRYPTKRDLVVAALSVGAPFSPPSVDLHGRAAIDAFIRQAVDALVGSGAIRILGSLLAEEVREPGLLQVFRARLMEPRRAMLAAVLERGVAAGEIRGDIDSLVVTEMLAGAVFGHHLILGQPTSDAWIDSLVDHVWRAIRAA